MPRSLLDLFPGESLLRSGDAGHVVVGYPVPAGSLFLTTRRVVFVVERRRGAVIWGHFSLLLCQLDPARWSWPLPRLGCPQLLLVHRKAFGSPPPDLSFPLWMAPWWARDIWPAVCQDRQDPEASLRFVEEARAAWRRLGVGLLDEASHEDLGGLLDASPSPDNFREQADDSSPLARAIAALPGPRGGALRRLDWHLHAPLTPLFTSPGEAPVGEEGAGRRDRMDQ